MTYGGPRRMDEHGRRLGPWECSACGRRDFPVVSLREDHEARVHGIVPEGVDLMGQRQIPGHRQTSNHRTCCSLGYALAVDLSEDDRALAESLIGHVPDIELHQALTRPHREGGVDYPPVAPYVSEQGIGRHRRKLCCCFRDEPPATVIRFRGNRP